MFTHSFTLSWILLTFFLLYSHLLSSYDVYLYKFLLVWMSIDIWNMLTCTHSGTVWKLIVWERRKPLESIRVYYYYVTDVNITMNKMVRRKKEKMDSCLFYISIRQKQQHTWFMICTIQFHSQATVLVSFIYVEKSSHEIAVCCLVCCKLAIRTGRKQQLQRRLMRWVEHYCDLTNGPLHLCSYLYPSLRT